MRNIVRSLATFAIFALMVQFARSQSGTYYQIFGKERLANSGTFEGKSCQFTTASEGKPATVTYPPGGWSGLVMSMPLDGRLGGEMVVHLHCRWEPDAIKNGVSGGVALMFTDSDGQDVGTRGGAAIRAGDADQEVSVEAAVPKDAVTFRVDVACSKGGGTLDIQDYTLAIEGVDLSRAADNGYVLPGLEVRGGEGNLPGLSADAAKASFNVSAPYSFDDPLWKTLPKYTIAQTTANKTSPGDVGASFQLAWNADNIFVRFHAHDKTLNFIGSNRYDRDCFEFFLMPTGEAGSRDMVTKEQYAVSRTPNGKTDSNGEAISRIAPDGWDAILKIPIKTDARRITPFNGFTMTFNAAYHDSNTMPEEHWLSFSKADQNNTSWENASVYVPFVFTTDENVAYTPFWKGDSLSYDVDPKFPGRINLIHSTATLDNIEAWEHPTDIPIEAYKDGDHDCFRFRFTKEQTQPSAKFTMSPFNVLAGETLTFEMEARADQGGPLDVPVIDYLSESNWDWHGFQSDVHQLNDQWQKITYTLPVSDRMRDNLRNGRLIFTVGASPGRTVELRDMKLTRRLPVDFDALITTPGRYSHFWQGEPGNVTFTFNSGIDASARISAKVNDYFTGKTLLSQEWTHPIAKDTTSSLDWDVSKLPNGFFNVVLKMQDDKGHFLAQRELYVSKGVKNTVASKFGALFLCSQDTFTAPRDIPGTIAILKDSGIGMLQYGDFFAFDSKGNIGDSRRFEELQALHDAGFETGMTGDTFGSHNIGRNWQAFEHKDFFDKLFTRTKGLFSHASFSNEPNLEGAWFNNADAREWAIYYRTFYNEITKCSPSTQAIVGSLNDIPVDYVRTAASENMNSFGYPVMGFHLYSTEPNSDIGYMDMLNSRKQLEEIHPGWDAWDTESGMVFYSFRAILDLQSKKPPMMLNSGYTRSYFFNNWDMIFPCADSNPLLPMTEFMNYVYEGMTPVGYMTTGDGGKVHVFLFKDGNGHGMATFWNTSHDAAETDLPIAGNGEMFDVFGNSIATAPNGSFHLTCDDRSIRYLKGVDVAVLMKDPSFVPAFKSSQMTPAADPGYITTTYLSLPQTLGGFDREVPVGQTSEFSISLHNADTTAAVNVALTGQGPAGLKINLEGNGAVALAPGESRILNVELLASGNIDPSSFSIKGTTAEGKKLLPLVFTVKTTPPIAVEGYSRAVMVKNNSGAASDVEITPTKTDFFFKPAIIKASPAPGASGVIPLSITLKAGYRSDFSTLNTPIFYTMNVHSPQGDYVKQGHAILFEPAAGDASAADFTDLPYAASPEHPGSVPFTVNYNLTWVGEGLRIVARVQDSSPVQGHDNGQLKKGGDCMILAAAANAGQSADSLGDGYFECGFAVYNNAPASYAWDGKNGLEAASTFPGTVTRVNRDANYIYYDVTIPKVNLMPGNGSTGGMSIAFVNRDLQGKDEIIELGSGIFPERDASKLGLLSKNQ